MKILIVGATGTLGNAIVKALSPRHELIKVSTNQGEFRVDFLKPDSISNLYKKVGDKFGPLDAVVCAAGKVSFLPLQSMTLSQYESSLRHKLLGQIDLVLQGIPYMHPNGSFTLISGILNRDPIVAGSAAACANGGLEGFVRTAAIELPQQLRINCVSPTIVSESYERLADYFRGFHPVEAARVGEAFCKSIEGKQTGQIYTVGF